MKLTPELKKKIDALPVKQLLSLVRFSTVGDAKFNGESGDYYLARLGELRNQDNDAYVRASKSIGW